MKVSNMFREQVESMTSWFSQWNECERTVALYSLLKRITPTQVKFLAQVLEQRIGESNEVQVLEDDANNTEFISHLMSENHEKMVLQLLTYLPLLRPGNISAKVEYLKIIPKVLSQSLENGLHIEESRQLLSYLLMHPAISQEDRPWIRTLEQTFISRICRLSSQHGVQPQIDSNTAADLLIGSGSGSGISGSNGLTSQNGYSQNGWHKFPSASDIHSSYEEAPPQHITACSTVSSQLDRGNNHHIPLHATSSAPPQFSSVQPPPSQPACSAPPNYNHRQLTRTLSVKPGFSVKSPSYNPAPMSDHVSDWLESHHDFPPNTHGTPMVPYHAPLSPQSSVTSSGSGGSETMMSHNEWMYNSRRSTITEGSGMRDVPAWLKCLRLHKYNNLFEQMTYEEMMNLGEEHLKKLNVTQGARRKILRCIWDLKGRQTVLRSLEKETEGHSVNLKAILTQMKGILNTPIKAFPPASVDTPPSPTVTNEGESSIHEGDLPAHFTHLMGKVCAKLLLTSCPDEDCFAVYTQLVDRCLNHEAFTTKQKNLLTAWKQNVYQLWHPFPRRYNLENRQRKIWASSIPSGVGLGGLIGQGRVDNLQVGGSAYTAKRAVVGGTTSTHIPLWRNHSLNPAIFTRPSMLEGKQAITRTHSAPLRSTNVGLSLLPRTGSSDINPNDSDYNARLESLCLRMTEHALGGSLDVSERNSTF